MERENKYPVYELISKKNKMQLKVKYPAVKFLSYKRHKNIRRLAVGKIVKKLMEKVHGKKSVQT